MKFCPTCQTHYDEDILRFCTKDGTPLVDENPPNFIGKPTENFSKDEADIEEQTVIRRKNSVPAQPIENSSFDDDENDAERIVIPTQGAAKGSQQVRPKQIPANRYPPPPPKQTNTAKVIFLTIVLTLFALLAVGGAFYFLTREGVDANRNTNLNSNIENVNIDTNVIDNSLFDPNFNTNVNANIDSNSNVNANTKTPTPTPTRTPTPTPTPDGNTNANSNANSNSNANANANANSTRTPTPRPSPSPTATPRPTPSSPVNVGNVNSRAVNLPNPNYPPAARNVQARGRVTVEVTIDENGRVLSATPTSGHLLLRRPAADAAKDARFNPVRVNGQPVKAVGTVVYNFVSN